MLPLSLLLAPTAQAGNVLVIQADTTYHDDVVQKLRQSGRFDAVDEFDATVGTPTAAALSTYDSVLVYSNNGFNNAALLGDRLADYVDSGGGVVEAVFANASVPLTGRFEAGGYEPITGNAQTQGVQLTMNVLEPEHPVLADVLGVNAGTSSYTSLNPGLGNSALRLANWSNGSVAVAVIEERFEGRTVGLNLFPPSSDARGDFWVAATDGVTLMANALEWCGAPDFDGDGVADEDDNCVLVPNTDQADGDGDFLGDACDFCDDAIDSDVDADGICDDVDACNGYDDQLDTDGDLTADGCDLCPLDNPNDPDSDGICTVDDQCANFDDAIDLDEDLQPDLCDPCPTDNPDDTDLDFACDSVDVCFGYDDLANADGDPFPDGCDLCPFDPAGADDTDNDGVCNTGDACPGFDDAIDRDNDDQPDACDPCPDSVPDDFDQDGVCDNVDLCLGFDDRLDEDGDGEPNQCDSCPFDPAGADDDDGDGVCNAADECPGISDFGDADGDGIPDGCDNCRFVRNSDQADLDLDLTGDRCDCNPEDPKFALNAYEVCDALDNDCDGFVDDLDDSVTGLFTWFEDRDRDGYGDEDETFEACDPGAYGVTTAGDCNDDSAFVFPGAEEICDDRDNDCDGLGDPTDLCGEEPVVAPVDDTGAEEPEAPVEDPGCGCASGPSGAASTFGALGFAVLLLRRRR